MCDEILISMDRVGIGNIPSENFSREQSSPADVCVIRYGNILAGCVVKFVRFNDELQRKSCSEVAFYVFLLYICCEEGICKELFKSLKYDITSIHCILDGEAVRTQDCSFG